MSFNAYMLRCSDGSYYVGHTDDLEARLAQHRHASTPGYTATRLPVELIWSESFPDREQAFAIERQIKGWSRAKKEALVRGDFGALRTLARRPVLRDAASPSSAAPQDERDRSTPPPPAIILVRPQLGENIGKAARAMLNFGLTDLRLVAPRDGWPNPDAGPAASGADVVLGQARVFDDLAGALADCAHVYATTVRRRGVVKPVLTPAAAAQAVRAAPGRSAFLFGPERSGLETDDVAVARAIVTVPVNPDFGSINLAQAVILLAYEWSKHAPSPAEGGEALSQPTLLAIDPPAPQGELDGMIGHLDRILQAAGYFFPPDRAEVDRRQLRSILTKPGWSAGEVRTLRGVLRSIERAQRQR